MHEQIDHHHEKRAHRKGFVKVGDGASMVDDAFFDNRNEMKHRAHREPVAVEPIVQVAADRDEQVEVFRASEPVRHAVEDLLDPAGSLTARRAFAARFVREELGETPRDEHGVDGLVEHHHRARSEHHPVGLLHEVHVERRVEVLVGACEPL